MVIRPPHRRIYLSRLSQDSGPPLSSGAGKRASDEKDRMKAGDVAAEKLLGLVRIYETLTPDMEAELGFTQLTRRET
jgi:hypothetical protein